MKKISNIADAIDELGGPTAVARLLGIKRPAVSMWKVGGRFPSSSYVAMTGLLRERGIECPPELWGMLPAKEPTT
jgi:hypothetical protein